jgi:hypothetical protein
MTSGAPASEGTSGHTACGRRTAVVLLLLLVPLGLYTKVYQGPLEAWVSNSLGGVFYEIFWCLFFFVLFPRGKPWQVVLPVFIVTCALEFLQLWHPAWLESLRAPFLGRALLGTSFAWSDIPYYAAGCGIGWWLLRTLRAPRNVTETESRVQ